MSNTIDSLTEPVEAPRRRVEPYLGETCREKRARAEEALARYPELDPDELSRLLHWYRHEASAMDVALLASDEALRERFQAFHTTHIAPYSWREKAITAALGAGVLGLFAFGLMAEAA